MEIFFQIFFNERICLSLSVKLCWKPYYKPLRSKSCEEGLTTAILFVSILSLLTGIYDINVCSFLYLHFNWLMLSSHEDLSIKLYKQLKSNIPTLFFKLSYIMVCLLHKSFKLCLCAIKCDCDIDFLALYLSFMLTN